MVEAGCMVVLAALFARVHSADVRGRVVFVADLAWLVAARLAFAAMAQAGLFSAGSYAECAWGATCAPWSLALGAAVAASMFLMGALVSRVTGRAALGLGDVWLYGVCCLLLDAAGVALFLGLSAAAGAVAALAAAARRRATFPFAPALVWSCWAALALRMASCAG